MRIMESFLSSFNYFSKYICFAVHKKIDIPVASLADTSPLQAVITTPLRK